MTQRGVYVMCAMTRARKYAAQNTLTIQGAMPLNGFTLVVMNSKSLKSLNGCRVRTCDGVCLGNVIKLLSKATGTRFIEFACGAAALRTKLCKLPSP